MLQVGRYDHGTTSCPQTIPAMNGNSEAQNKATDSSNASEERVSRPMEQPTKPPKKFGEWMFADRSCCRPPRSQSSTKGTEQLQSNYLNYPNRTANSNFPKNNKGKSVDATGTPTATFKNIGSCFGELGHMNPEQGDGQDQEVEAQDPPAQRQGSNGASMDLPTQEESISHTGQPSADMQQDLPPNKSVISRDCHRDQTSTLAGCGASFMEEE